MACAAPRRWPPRPCGPPASARAPPACARPRSRRARLRRSGRARRRDRAAPPYLRRRRLVDCGKRLGAHLRGFGLLGAAAGHEQRRDDADHHHDAADRERDRVAVRRRVAARRARCAARIDAATWAPMAPPIVRTIVFIPVATPVWSGGTASTMRFASDAKARPTPMPSSARRRRSPSCESRATSTTNESVVTIDAEHERHLRADHVREPAAERAEDQHRDRRRHEEQPGLRDRGAEAVAGRVRRLHELRDQHERAVHPEAEQQRGEVRRPDAAQPHHRACRRAGASSASRPGPRRARAPTASDEQAERLRPSPSPRRRRLADAEEQRRPASPRAAPRRAS